MKKNLKVLFSLLLMLALTLSLTAGAFADDETVTYKGGTKTFTFGPDANLFNNFEDAMPGDTLTQKVVISVTPAANAQQTKIYLRAEAVKTNLPDGETAETMADFLSQLQMTVKQGTKTLYESTPDKPAGLTNNVLLGTFTGTGKQTATLTIELTVPTTLDNEYANRTGLVKWVFTAEQIDKAGGGGVNPNPDPNPTPTPEPSTSPEPSPEPTPEVIQPITPEETIPSEDIPKADFTDDSDKGNAWALLNLIFAILSVADSGWMISSFLKSNKEETLTESAMKQNRLKPFTAIPAVGSVITFLLTQNMRNPMVLADKWTILMTALLAVNGGLTYFAKKKTEEPLGE